MAGVARACGISGNGPGLILWGEDNLQMVDDSCDTRPRFKSERKMRNLTFLDFCEAIVRLACIVALPTDAELEEAKAEDAGEYLHALMDGGSGEMSSFVAERKTGWQSQPRQHVSRCVHHLVSILTRTILSDVGHGEVHVRNGVTLEDAENFESRRKQGRTLHHVQAAGSMLDGIRAAQSIIRARLLTALQKVEIFSVLSVEQIETLCGAMSQAKFDEGEYVFEQGDDGDAFYIITEGQAVVLRNEPGEEVEELATLGEGAFFGERALIKNQVRYAGIQAHATALCCVYHPQRIRNRAWHQAKISFQTSIILTLQSWSRPRHGVLFVNLTRASPECRRSLYGDQVQGQDVIRQGDTGDALYMITGHRRYCACQRATKTTTQAKARILAQLSHGVFWNRALIKNEKRCNCTSDERRAALDDHIARRDGGCAGREAERFSRTDTTDTMTDTRSRRFFLLACNSCYTKASTALTNLG